MKNLQVKTRAENVRFLSWTTFFVGKYGIQSTNEMAFKKKFDFRHLIWCAHSIGLYCHLADSRMRMQNALLFRGTYVSVKSKLQHAPPRAFDTFAVPGRREFDYQSLPGGGEFDPHALGVGNLNCTLDFM